MAAWRTIRQKARGAFNSRPAKALLISLLILTLLPIAGAFAFPEPNDRRLCAPDQEAPPRLASEEEIQASASSSTPSVQILNPLSGGKVSDKYDGTDRRYHITAVAVGVPSDAVLEAVVQRSSSGEVVLGTLCPVEGTRDTFEGFWDIPDTFPEGGAEFIVNAFDRAGDGAQVIATDKVTVDVQHLAGGVAADEDVRLLWPANDGPLGFFRNKAGEWRVSVQARTSQATGTPAIRYSTTPLGGEPAFRACAALTSTSTNRTSDSTTVFDFSCRLAAGDRPSAVTAIGGIAKGGTGSSDAHRVHPFLQRSSDMVVRLDGVFKGASPLSPPLNYPSSRRRGAAEECLVFKVTVHDRFSRPVSGVNVDAELRGPSENASFGEPVSGSTTSVPDGAAVTEPTVQCSSGTPDATLRQARVTVADGPDAKLIESLDGTNDQGQWSFQIYSTDPGFAQLRAWVDDEVLESELAERPPDDDQLGSEEATGSSEGQWLEGPMQLDINPRDEAAGVGSCRIYRVSAIAGSTPLPDFNIDLHVRIPDPDLKLCGEDRLVFADSNHPIGHSHPPDEARTNPPACPGGGRPCVHLEGITDEQGELVFGLSSTVTGRASVVAWADGEPGEDTDLQSSKPSFTLATEWVDESSDSSIRLLSPSRGAETANGLQKVSAGSFRVIARVSSPELVDKVSIQITKADSTEALVSTVARQVGNSNFYEFNWRLGEVVDGMYTVTASVDEKRADSRALEVNRTVNPPDDVAVAFESASLTSPQNGAPLGFVAGTTKLSGQATSGSEGVFFFYTTVGLTQEPVWKPCGQVLFPHAANATPRAFTDQVCSLQGIDEANTVSGVAVVAFNCEIPYGESPPLSSCAHPSPSPVVAGVSQTAPPRRGAFGAGDTVAVMGCEGSPCIVQRPMNWSATRGTCVALSVHVVQQAQPVKNQRVALTLKGPTDRIRFCDPDDQLLGGPWLASPEIVETDPYGPDVHQISGFTDRSGEFHYGVRSEDSNFASIFSAHESAESTVTAWLDDGDLDLEPGEQVETSAIHWQLPGRCTLVGSNLSDSLVGTETDDKICGLAGDDVIPAVQGNDVVLGGDGNDTIYGDEGNDSLYGDDGDDVLRGGPGKDLLDGGAGDDVCRPGPGERQTMISCETVTEPKKRASGGRNVYT